MNDNFANILNIFNININLNDLFNVLNSCPKESLESKIFEKAHTICHQSDKEKINLFFKKIISSYDNAISMENKIKLLLLINDPQIFHDYALKYYKIFEQQLNKYVFVDLYCEDDTSTLTDVQTHLDIVYGKDLYKIYNCPFYTIPNALYDFYKLFHHVTHFYCNGTIIPWDNNLFYSMNNQELMQILLSSNDKNIWRYILVNNQDDFAKIINSFSKLEQEKVISSFLDYLKTESSSWNYLYQDKFEEYWDKMRPWAGTALENQDNLQSIYEISYLQSLNILNNISKDEMKKTSLYLRCYQIFLHEILRHFEDSIDKNDFIVFEAIFRRIIQGQNLLKILQITDLKKLYHYFKTNELIVKFSSLSLDEIKNYNAKQYLLIKNKIEICRNKNMSFEYVSYSNEQYLEIFIVFGYDFLTKVDLYFYNLDFQNILLFVKNKNELFKENFKKVLLEKECIEFLKKNSLDIFLNVYDYLFQNKYKKLTWQAIKKCLDSLDYCLFPNNKILQEPLTKLNLINKGNPLLEKIEGIKLYDLYRFRIYSSIPDVCGKFGLYIYQMVDMHDPNIIADGIGEYYLPNNIFASSCLTPNGKAASCLAHGALNPNGRFFKVTFQGKILAYSWVWRCGNVLCFDNIEVTKQLIEIENYEDILSTIYLQAAQKLVQLSEFKENKNGIKLVILGKNEKDITISNFNKLPKINDCRKELYKPNYSKKLYLKDSESTQIILWGEYHEDLNINDVEPKYLYPRKKIKNITNFNEKETMQLINSIYFDHCLDNNIQYRPLTSNKYQTGYLAEDWFIGITQDGKKEYFSCGKDFRSIEEAQKYMPLIHSEERKSIFIGSDQEKQLLYLTNPKNYLIDPDLKNQLPNLLGAPSVLSSDDYLHGTYDLKNFGKIMLEKAITSVDYGNHFGGDGTNGNYYICVAKIEDNATKSAFSLPSFVIDKNIFAFGKKNDIISENTLENYFIKTAYPLRTFNKSNEYQVYKSISLAKAKAILISSNIYNLAMIIYLQEYAQNDLPLIMEGNHQILKKELVKNYIKLK